MLKREIKYKNVNTGEQVVDSFYFNLTTFEVAEIQLMEDLQAVGKSSNPREIIPVFKRIVRNAVGRNVGGEFRKPENYGDMFVASDAYSELFLDILGGDNAEIKMTEFIRAIIPPEMVSDIVTTPTVAPEPVAQPQNLPTRAMPEAPLQ